MRRAVTHPTVRTKFTLLKRAPLTTVQSGTRLPPGRGGPQCRSGSSDDPHVRTAWLRTLTGTEVDSARSSSARRVPTQSSRQHHKEDPGPYASVSSDSIFQDYARKAQQDVAAPSWVSVGDVKAGLSQAVKTHQATYWTDFVAHMQMEPLN